MQRKSIYDDYVKDKEIVDTNEVEKEEELVENIRKSKILLGNMYNNLQYAEGDLIDYYTYQIKAEESKYDFLIKQAKKKKIKII